MPDSGLKQFSTASGASSIWHLSLGVWARFSRGRLGWFMRSYRILFVVLLLVQLHPAQLRNPDRSNVDSPLFALAPPNKFPRFETYVRMQKTGVGRSYPRVLRTAANVFLAAEEEVNVTLDSDPLNPRFVDGIRVENCSSGVESAQNEFAVAVHPTNPRVLIAGGNDYRVFDSHSKLIDTAGAYYRSTDGGRSWTVSLLPGLVKGNKDSPGSYEAAGDPSVAAGPPGIFWYGNLVFNREDDASAIAVSRTLNSGVTWTTNFAVQTSAEQGAALFNDKPWIAADPIRGQVGHVIWSQFTVSLNTYSIALMFSTTNDAGSSFSSPQRIGSKELNSGAVGFVDRSGALHLVWTALDQINSDQEILYAVKPRNSRSFDQIRVLAQITGPSSPLSWSKFRCPTLPGFVLDGNSLHVVWQSWNGIDSDIVYMRSIDKGRTWTAPATVAGLESDQFFPWVGARNGKVFISFLDHFGEGPHKYHAAIVASRNHGSTWTDPMTLTSVSSDVRNGNRFRNSRRQCGPHFIGDYTGIAVGSDGVAHPFWVDTRDKDQDPFTTRVAFK